MNAERAENQAFDPEKVQRLWLDWEDEKGGGWEDDFVFAQDYDELLKLHKEQAGLTDAKIREAVEKATVAVTQSMQTMFVQMMKENEHE